MAFKFSRPSENSFFGLLPFQVFQPESIVGILVVEALVAAVAVHAVGIDHEVEVRTDPMEGVDELQGVLVVDVVVAGAMG